MSPFASLPRIASPPTEPTDGSPGDPWNQGTKEQQATYQVEIELTASAASSSGSQWSPREKMRMVCGWQQHPLANPYRAYDQNTNRRVRPDGTLVDHDRRDEEGSSTCISADRRALFEPPEEAQN